MKGRTFPPNRSKEKMTLNFFQKLSENQNRMPDHVALQYITRDTRESFSYSRVAEEVSKIGEFLKDHEIGPGASVGILMENHPRWGIAFLAIQSAGARVVPLDTLNMTKTMAELIQHAECQFLISSHTLLTEIDEIQRALPEPLPILMTGESVEEYFHWETALEQYTGMNSFPLVERPLDDPFVILYTSGTTGNPKGVVLTRRNLYCNVVEVLNQIQVSSQDHILSVLPLYHVLALMVNFMIPLYVGARVSYLDSLDAQQILKSFNKEQITIFICVPQFYYLAYHRILQEVQKQTFVKRFVFNRLLELSRFCNDRLSWNPGKLFFSSIHQKFGSRFRIFGVGGAHFDPKIARALRDLGFTIVQAYGMTETAALATLTPLKNSHVGSVGIPLSHMQIRIDQPDSNDVGEILIGGESVMSGYWKNPKATEETIRAGWLHSGDLGYLTEQGHLYITGREKDVIVLSSGKNIFPEEVEHFYQNACPQIKEICVVGVCAQTSIQEQEKLHAVIVPDFEYMKSQQTTNSREIIRYMLETASQQLPLSKRVHSFEIRRDPLPRTTTRKIKRFQVKEELENQGSATMQSDSTEPIKPKTITEDEIFKIIQEMKRIEVSHDGMSLELDLGFDSLERVELVSTIQERCRVQIPDEVAAQILTVGELVKAVEGMSTGELQEHQDIRLSWNEILKEPLQPEDQKKVQEILAPKPLVEFAFYLVAKVTYALSVTLFRLKVTGKENLPREYPYLICPNHLSFLDAFFVVAPLPYRVIKKIFFLGYADYFNRFPLTFLGRLIKVIPVDADRHLRQALRLGAEGIMQGYCLCVFPEGERSINGHLKPFRKGAAILAKELKVPVVPTAIMGTYEVWPRGINKIKLHPVTLRFGSLVDRPSEEDSYESYNERLFHTINHLIKKDRE
ncbi:MAG: AMP-binding protein [Acidobacteriota bacterium]|nr:AMP-binding protein [Acidobacteriota bacterium]